MRNREIKAGTIGLSLFLSGALHAQSTWTGGGTDDNFTTAANWTVAPTASSNTVFIFTGSTRLTPNVNGDYRASSITFDSNAGAFTILGTPTTANTRFTAPSSGNLTIDQQSAANQQINAILMNQATSLIVQGGGAGTLTLAGVRQTSSGASIVANRNVIFGNGFYSTNLNSGTPNLTYTIGSSASSNATFSSDPFAGLNPGGTRLIQLGATSGAINGTLTFDGAFTTAGSLLVRSGFSGGGEALLTGSSAVILGNLNFDGSADRTLLVNNASVGGVSFSGATTLGPASGSRTITFNVGSGSTLNLNGVVQNNGANPGAINKLGVGTLVLSNANTYSGGTTINAGTIRVTNASGSGTGGGAVTVGVNGTLAGTGSISGATTVSGILSPGAGGIGTLSITNDVTWNAGGAWAFDLGTPGPSIASPGVSDLLLVGGGLIKGTGTTFTFDFQNTGAAGFYKLIDYNGTTLFDAPAFAATNLPSGLIGVFHVDSGTSAVYVEVGVPEPATAGLVVLACGAMLRRRRASAI